MRHSRAERVPVASSERIASAVAASAVAVGSKTYARSLDDPSPFTSPEMTGVYRSPELSRSPAVTYTRSNMGKSAHVSITE